MERLFVNFLEQASDSLVKKSVDYFLFPLTKVPILLSTEHTISFILELKIKGEILKVQGFCSVHIYVVVLIRSLVQYFCVLSEVKDPEAVLSFIVFSTCVNIFSDSTRDSLKA